MKPRTEPQRHLEKEFAKTLARFLEKEALKKSYQRLVLVASPNMLGDLRSELSVHALAAVSDQVNKDLVHMDDAAVAKHLSEIVN
jgi:protein required for attachment to host cells